MKILHTLISESFFSSPKNDNVPFGSKGNKNRVYNMKTGYPYEVAKRFENGEDVTVTIDKGSEIYLPDSYEKITTNDYKTGKLMSIDDDILNATFSLDGDIYGISLWDIVKP